MQRLNLSINFCLCLSYCLVFPSTCFKRELSLILPPQPFLVLLLIFGATHCSRPVFLTPCSWLLPYCSAKAAVDMVMTDNYTSKSTGCFLGLIIVECPLASGLNISFKIVYFPTFYIHFVLLDSLHFSWPHLFSFFYTFRLYWILD